MVKKERMGGDTSKGRGDAEKLASRLGRRAEQAGNKQSGGQLAKEGPAGEEEGGGHSSVNGGKD